MAHRVRPQFSPVAAVDGTVLAALHRGMDAAPAEARPSPASRILGIDPGLDRTGYAVIELPGPRVLDAGLLRTSNKTSLADRLAEIHAGLDEILAEFSPALIAVEELYAHYKHPRTAILMGHARGVVLLAGARRNIDVVNLPATRIKKALTGNGHASKIQMQRAIVATLGLSKRPEPADVADALAIALCAALNPVARVAVAPVSNR